MPVPLGEKIHTLRKEKKMTLDQLGALTGSSKSYLWELERGRIPRPSADKLHRIAQALDITTSYLVDEEREQPDEEALDQVFFRKYQELPSDTRKKVRELIDVWSKA
ncbi:MAG: helix-turn-helix domain-containing protein [Magnetococcales bacterium]|nr:helix-turn-helix domain-containing protein [Magnetococcales bacterium]MBF0117003.1 helix-turn-helix domain-containing protein [Magnetococcales bacterium]